MTGWKKEYILDDMTWKQVIFYYNSCWEIRQTEAKVFWGTYGALMSEDNHENTRKKTSKVPIEEIQHYPGYENAYYDEKGKLIKE